MESLDAFSTTPQFLYLILVIPSLFGLTLFGQGFSKVIRHEWYGVISMAFGFVFIGVVFLAYLFFSTYVE
jgi:hypothetical protein